MLSIDPKNVVRLDDIDEPLQCELGLICATVKMSASVMPFNFYFIFEVI